MIEGKYFLEENNEMFRRRNNKWNGKWTQQENVIYFKFLIEWWRDFERPGERRKNQIFLKLSKRLGTRTPDQCRSHHQKIENQSSSKQIQSLCLTILKKLENSKKYDDLIYLYKTEKEQIMLTNDIDEGFQIRQDSHKVLGNNKGEFSVLVDLQYLIKW